MALLNGEEKSRLKEHDMAIKRDMSKRTWTKLDDLVAKIRQRASQKKDDETYKDADEASLLLRNLASEIQIEDDHQT